MLLMADGSDSEDGNGLAAQDIFDGREHRTVMVGELTRRIVKRTQRLKWKVWIGQETRPISEAALKAWTGPASPEDEGPAVREKKPRGVR